MKRGVSLAELPLDEFQAAHPVMDEYRVRGAGCPAGRSKRSQVTDRPTRNKSPINSRFGESGWRFSASPCDTRENALYIDDDTMTETLILAGLLWHLR